MIKLSELILIFADGACLGNPGPGAAASIIADAHHVVEVANRESPTTNNRMEILAVMQALLALKSKKPGRVIVHSDSQYVMNGIQKWVKGWKRNGWKTADGQDVKNKELWQEFLDVYESTLKTFEIQFVYVPGHSGIPGNERCDEIANTLASGSELFLYDGSRKEYPVDLLELTPTKTKKSSHKSSKTTASTYYVSVVGGTVHRDKTWKECEARVKGVRGAKYKKCSSAEEEAEILRGWGVRV